MYFNYGSEQSQEQDRDQEPEDGSYAVTESGEEGYQCKGIGHIDKTDDGEASGSDMEEEDEDKGAELQERGEEEEVKSDDGPTNNRWHTSSLWKW